MRVIPSSLSKFLHNRTLFSWKSCWMRDIILWPDISDVLWESHQTFFCTCRGGSFVRRRSAQQFRLVNYDDLARLLMGHRTVLWELCYVILPGKFGSLWTDHELSHCRETNQLTSIMRWDRGYFSWLACVTGWFWGVFGPIFNNDVCPTDLDKPKNQHSEKEKKKAS